MDKKLIYAVDDEMHIRELISYNLESAGFQVRTFSEGESLLSALQTKTPDLILLDIMLEGLSGTEICKIIREDSSCPDIPIIMLTAKGSEFDKIIGLEGGADDYITKPFSVNELIARIRALLRRSQHPAPSVKKLIAGDIILDDESHEVRKDGQLISLTFKEYELLKLLMGNKNRVYSRSELLDKIWGYEYCGDTRTVDVHIRQLRKHLNDDSEQYIKTVRGVGYKWME